MAIVKQRAKLGTPYSRYLPNGIPAGIFVLAFKMIQASQEIVILFEGGDPPRQIHTDGRSLPRDPEPSWMGYSVGKWERDTLAVETSVLQNRAGWMGPAIRAANRCTSPSTIAAAISGIWILR